jgi:hypothetical protein
MLFVEHETCGIAFPRWQRKVAYINYNDDDDVVGTI